MEYPPERRRPKEREDGNDYDYQRERQDDDCGRQGSQPHWERGYDEPPQGRPRSPRDEDEDD